MRFLRTNTATRIGIGPFIGTDGLTPKTSLTVTNCKLTMVVDTGGVPTLVLDTNPTASGGSNDMVHISGDDAGMYDLELAAADVNYLGRGKIIVTDAANHLPVWEDVVILPANVYDALILGTDNLEVDMIQWLGTAPLALTSQRPSVYAAVVATNAIDAAALNADAGTEIGTAVWASGTRTLTSGANIALAKGTGVTGFNDLSAAQVNAEVDTALADYDAPTKAEMDTSVSTLATAADLATAQDSLDAIQAKTDDLTFTKANELDVNIHSINDVTVTGTGVDGDEWGPG